MISLSLPNPPKILEKKGNFAKFEIEGLYPGYGVTIGNSIRRVLLSSLPGAAITQVKIKGVQHEFSTIPWVFEDVVNILLNLKQLRFKLHTSEPQTGTLKVKGEKKVEGADFQLPSEVEILNKDVHVATLTDKKAELEMEILVEKGLGYEPVERRKKQKMEIGVFALDAIFTPVRKVAYRVENMRVGERTDFDRLHVELETDGTIAPEEAFFQACQILVDHFSLFSKSFQKEVEKAQEPKPAGGPRDIRITELKLSTRTRNALLKGGIAKVGDILQAKEAGISKLRGIGGGGV